MKRHILFIIIFLTASTSIFAQSAEELYTNIVNKTKSFKNIEIAFEYKMINKQAGINESMNGTGFMQGNAYRLNVNGQEMISDGTTLWTYLTDDQEVMVSNVNQAENSGSPLAIIDSYNDNVKINFIDKGISDVQTIEIKTIKKDEKFDRIKISVNKKTLEIKSVHVFDNNGNEFVYELFKFVTDQELPADFFTFDEKRHPDVDVIDMR